MQATEEKKQNSCEDKGRTKKDQEFPQVCHAADTTVDYISTNLPHSGYTAMELTTYI